MHRSWFSNINFPPHSKKLKLIKRDWIHTFYSPFYGGAKAQIWDLPHFTVLHFFLREWSSYVLFLVSCTRCLFWEPKYMLLSCFSNCCIKDWTLRSVWFMKFIIVSSWFTPLFFSRHANRWPSADALDLKNVRNAPHSLYREYMPLVWQVIYYVFLVHFEI